MKVPEAAKRLEVSNDTIKRHIKLGNIQATRGINGHWSITEEEIERIKKEGLRK